AAPAFPKTPSRTSSMHSRISALMSLPPRPVSRRTGAGATAASKGEGEEAAVGADIEPIAGGQQILEMSQPGHRILRTAAGKQRLAGVPAIAVQPIVSFGAEDPDDRVRAAIGRRDDWRALASQSAAPPRRQRGRRPGADLQDGQRVVAAGIRAMRAPSLECDIGAFAGGIGRRRGADRISRHGFRSEAAANAAENTAIEEKGAGVLAECQNE